MMLQPFDDDGNVKCIACLNVIGNEEFWVEVRQRSIDDEDSRLACHTACLQSGVLSTRKLSRMLRGNDKTS